MSFIAISHKKSKESGAAGTIIINTTDLLVARQFAGKTFGEDGGIELVYKGNVTVKHILRSDFAREILEEFAKKLDESKKPSIVKPE